MEKHQQFKAELDNATRVVHGQLSRLKMLESKYTQMDGDLTKMISFHIKEGNNHKARVVASELANMRRVNKTSRNASVALEVMMIRLSTIGEFSSLLDTISPTIDMIKEIQKDMSVHLTKGKQEISEINDIFRDVLTKTDIPIVENKVSTKIDSDALDILNEVQNRIENETRAKLPEVPSISATREKSVVNAQRIMIES